MSEALKLLQEKGRSSNNEDTRILSDENLREKTNNKCIFRQ
jgi:hypothetical protein